jgi:cytochrome c
VPAIAVSSLIVVEKNRVPYWQGDLLIGSFSASLIRARIRAGRVVTLEHVRLRNRKGRIRDLFEDRDGNIVLWFDDGPIGFLEPADSMSAATSLSKEARGQFLFAACAGCHAVADGATHGIGPDLAGIMDRPIADSDGFRYSPALAGLPGRWTEKALDRFLTDPQAFAPGNTMVFSGLADPADRSDLIAYLKGAKRREER